MTEDNGIPEEDLNNEDFQFVLGQLLAAYRPILKQELDRAEDPKMLTAELAENPPSCEDELKLAERLFDDFSSEKVTLRLLSATALEQLGPVEQWRWCIAHLRCCLIFGWLVRRAPTFRAAVRYLWYYWLCVRRVHGIAPDDRPLTADEREDFNVLVRGLADVYKPFLEGQRQSTEASADVAAAVIEGEIDCREGIAEANAIFNRFLTVDRAPALFGKQVFEEHQQAPHFWFCRCWCLCAIKFGWCLAGAKSILDVVRCLIAYLRCIRDCFQPLVCGLQTPEGCVEEDVIQTPALTLFRGVEITGSASGAFCSHYTLEWREAGTVPWRSDGVRYSGNPEPAQGQCGVVNGVLGYLTTYPLVPAGPVEIRLCVHSSQPGTSPSCCTLSFELQRNLVWIRGIEGIEADEPPGILDSTAQLVDSAGVVRSFGASLRVMGSAAIGGCEDKALKRYTLSFHPGFVTDPLLPGFVQFWQVDYINGFQTAYGQTHPINEQALTNRWRRQRICLPPPVGCFTIGNYLQAVRWNTLAAQSFRVEPIDPPTAPNPPIWTSTPVPTPNCRSGRHTLRLTVEDIGGGLKHDLQQVWIDNKDIHGKITQIAGVPPCAIVELSKFAAPGADCAVAWPAQLSGIAFDELIEEGNTAQPSDNFGGYTVSIKKDGGSYFPVPIPGPGVAPWGPPFVGTSRVGDPGTRCPNAVPAGPPPGPEVVGTLATLDMRRLDAVCNPAEPGLTLKRGECCGFVVALSVWDTSICPGLSGGRHEAHDQFPFYICNNLPPVDIT
ncbi:MAG: hypothetical protein AAFX92_00135 [Pseudomonadota bacterium]